jgi:ribose 5-phosphate isomerase RpiB
MKSNGDIPANGGPVLSWPRRVLSSEDLRRHLTSQRELLLLPRTVITPLAADELKLRGIRVSWQESKAQAGTPRGTPNTAFCWRYAQEQPLPAVAAAIAAVERDGMQLIILEAAASSPWEWARAVAEAVARAQCPGVVCFCGDRELLCCVANKVSGIRAAAVANAAQATRARQTFGANLLAVENTGRTFFELRQILRAICGNGSRCCPAELAKVLQELDGHAHR